MEKFYTAYKKTINGVPFYFVKQYQSFPEYKNIEPVLDTFGMHLEFKKACKIAMITDKIIQQQLLDTIETNTVSAKLIKMKRSKSATYSYSEKQTKMPSLLKLINLG